MSDAMPTHAEINQRIALTGRILGSLLYTSPESPELEDIISSLSEPDWENEWPCGDHQRVAVAAADIRLGLTDEAESARLDEEFQRLFIGPDALPAPPWGSVYLDRESVLFGDSTLALRGWLRRVGIELESDKKEPEDHIGTLLLMAAWVAEEQARSLPVLLAEHILPWSSRYLALLEEGSDHPFYRGLAVLTQATLDDWKTVLALNVPERDLYR